MSKKCPNCGSDNSEVVIKFVDGGIGYKCNDCGELFMLLTLFANITASPEVLAEKLVFPMWDGAFSWESTVIPTVKFSSRAEAIAATVAKLKEVCDE